MADAKKPKNGGKLKNPILRGRFVIHTDQPYEELDMPGAKAFQVVDQRKPDDALYGLICPPDMPLRYNSMPSVRGMTSSGMLRLIEYGPIYWAPAKKELMCLVYQRPLGGRIMPLNKSRIPPVLENDFIGKHAKNLTEALAEMGSRGIVHRSIRPDNMYYLDGEKTKVVFGDCLTALPGFYQPAVCETIESMMCEPAGRGVGSSAQDLYAFGVTALALVRGEYPCSHMTDAELLEHKVEYGSYAVLVRDERISMPIMELLRGLLVDDPEQRWDLETLQMWEGGRRLSPLQAKAGKRARRVFSFKGGEYYVPRKVSLALGSNWEEAVPYVTEGRVEDWVRRGYDDVVLADDIKSTIVDVQAAIPNHEIAGDHCLAKILMLLDPAAPLRYKGFAFMPEAIGPLMAYKVMKKEDLQPLMDLIMGDLPDFYYGRSGAYVVAIRSFNDMRQYMKRDKIGFGFEKCLYEMNRGMPCLSPLLDGYFVNDIRKLLPALEKMSQVANQSGWPVDRHIAAFVGARFRTEVAEALELIDHKRKDVAAGAMVNLLMILQWKLGPDHLPGLTEWVGKQTEPIVSSYHSRKKRKEMTADLPKLVKNGSLPDLYNFLENSEERTSDTVGFDRAQRRYMKASQDISYMNNNKEFLDREAMIFGQKVSAVLSFLISMCAMVIVLLMRLKN